MVTICFIVLLQSLWTDEIYWFWIWHKENKHIHNYLSIYLYLSSSSTLFSEAMSSLTIRLDKENENLWKSIKNLYKCKLIGKKNSYTIHVGSNWSRRNTTSVFSPHTLNSCSSIFFFSVQAYSKILCWFWPQSATWWPLTDFCF